MDRFFLKNEQHFEAEGKDMSLAMKMSVLVGLKVSDNRGS
jgi:hypothetical protein